MSRITCFPTVSGEQVRGRRPQSESLYQRRRHIRCAYCRLIQDRSPQWIRRHFGISVRTMQLWVRAALNYDDPEAQTLRDLVARGAPC
jgi:hypothetical protein